MPIDIVLPNLGFDAKSGTLIEWTRGVGDVVLKGDVIAVIESDKAEVELESVAAGVIAELCLAEGDEAPVGAVIARLTGDGESARDPSPDADRQDAPMTARQADPDDPAAAEAELPLALPKVRLAARRAGISLGDLLAAGYANPISHSDLRDYQRESGESPEYELVARSPMQIRAADRLSRSMREAPHFYAAGEFDLEAALQRLPDALGVNDLLQYIIVRALRDAPQLNARWEEGELRQYRDVNLALAVAVDRGLIAPVIRAAQDCSMTQLAQRSAALIAKAHAGRLASGELAGGSFTISNLGMLRAVDHFSAVINPPQVAIAAIGSVKRRALVIAGGLHLRRSVWITISGDHRFLDGLALGRFLNAIQAQLDELGE